MEITGRLTVTEVLPVIHEFEVAFKRRICISHAFEKIEHAWDRRLEFDYAPWSSDKSGAGDARFPAFFVG